MPPYSIPFFPSGDGVNRDVSVKINNDNILLTTMQKRKDGIAVRLFNTQNSVNTTDVFVLGSSAKISLEPFEYRTYIVKNGKISEVWE